MRSAKATTTLLFAFLVWSSMPACSDSSKVGIGAKCASTDDCQASSCNDGICVKNCTTDIDCPAPTKCYANLCQYPLRVGAMYSGSASETEGWTFACNQGLVGALAELPYAQLFIENQIYGDNDPPLIAPAVKRLVEEQHVDVIVATDSSEDKELKTALKDYPNVKFVEYKEPGSSFHATDAPNVTTYTSHSDAGWYLAGKLAVQRTHAKRLGFIAGYIAPSAVQTANAFTLGARSEDPSVVVEVRWIGFWIDLNASAKFPYKGDTYFREDLLTRQLIDGGAKVIASSGDSGRPIRTIEALHASRPDLFSVSTNFRYAWQDLQTKAPFPSCLGSVYYNFSPYLKRTLDSIHKLAWLPNDFDGFIEQALDDSMVGFEPNTTSGVDDANVRKVAATLISERGLDLAHSGPYKVTGQLDLDGDGNYDAVQEIPAGQFPTEAERSHMCWFVDGVVEKQLRDDTNAAASEASPGSPDVPAHVPDDHYPAPAGVVADLGTNCKLDH